MEENIARIMITILDLYGEIVILLFQHKETGEQTEIWLDGPNGDIGSNGTPLSTLLSDENQQIVNLTTEGKDEPHIRELAFLLNPLPMLSSLDSKAEYSVDQLVEITGLDNELVQEALALWGVFPTTFNKRPFYSGLSLLNPPWQLIEYSP